MLFVLNRFIISNIDFVYIELSVSDRVEMLTCFIILSLVGVYCLFVYCVPIVYQCVPIVYLLCTGVPTRVIGAWGQRPLSIN